MRLSGYDWFHNPHEFKIKLWPWTISESLFNSMKTPEYLVAEQTQTSDGSSREHGRRLAQAGLIPTAGDGS